MKMNPVMQRTARRLGSAGFVRLPSASHPELTDRTNPLADSLLQLLIDPSMGDGTLEGYIDAVRQLSKGEVRVYGRSGAPVETASRGNFGLYVKGRLVDIASYRPGVVQYVVLEPYEGDGAEIAVYNCSSLNHPYIKWMRFHGNGKLKEDGLHRGKDLKALFSWL